MYIKYNYYTMCPEEKKRSVKFQCLYLNGVPLRTSTADQAYTVLFPLDCMVRIDVIIHLLNNHLLSSRISQSTIL